MNPVLIRKAAALPARQLHLLGAGLLLIVAAALWFYALRAPLAALRTVRAEQAQLDLAVGDPRALAAQLALLEADTAQLAKRFGATPSVAPAQAQVRLVGQLGALAQSHGVSLHGVTPAPDQTVLAFTQSGYDVQASGTYAALLAWMHAVDGAQAGLAVAGFTMRPGDTPGQVVASIRIAAYRPQENTP
jgi:Tfp pilus assembly protein PilO